MTVKALTTALKCFEMLEIVAEAERPARLAELARASGQSRATAYQRLVTLCEAGWVDRLPDDRYRLSLRACRLAGKALSQAGLGERALPILGELTAETGQTSSLIIVEGGRLIIAQRVEAYGLLRADLRVGAELFLEDSASALIWLAFGPPVTAAAICRHHELDEMPAGLAAVRRDGYAEGGGGRNLRGIKAVAVPIMGPDVTCIASLSLTGPDFGFATRELIPPLKRAADALSNAFQAAEPL
jgi:DNA-binding IclR family transcriptional regulator